MLWSKRKMPEKKNKKGKKLFKIRKELNINMIMRGNIWERKKNRGNIEKLL